MTRILSRMRSLLERWLPPRCVFCGLAAGATLCAGCRADLPRPGPACPRCAEPLAAAPGQAVCPACLARPPPWSRCTALYPYAWPVDVALQRLKFGAALPLGRAFGELLEARIAQDYSDVDALCPVPLHRLRHLRRGFNQARELCLPAAARWPLFDGVHRVRNTPPQSGLGQRARRRNLADAFRVTAAGRDRHVLIVDDVLTTGETCRHLAQALLEAGFAEVSVLVVARATQLAKV